MNSRTHHISSLLAVAVLVFALSPAANASAQTQDGRVQSLTLGVVSQARSERIEAHFREFVDHVARKLSSGQEIKGSLFVAPTALQLVKPLEEKQVDFYMESPYPTYLINRQGSATLLLRGWRGGLAEYRSILFTGKESGLKGLEELRGKLIAFEDPGSTSGFFMPKVFLLRKGFTVTEKPGLEAKISPKEIGYIFTHSERKTVDLVLSKQLAGGAVSNDDYARLDDKKRLGLAILAETDALPRHLLSVRKDLNPTMTKRLKAVLLSMHEDDEGRKILRQIDNTTKFDPLPGGEEAVRRKLVDLYRSRLTR